MNATTTDTCLGRWDDSAASMARDHFKRTGRRTSPYTSRPERESYTSTEIYARPDGSRYLNQTEVYRWGGVYSYDAPTTTEVKPGAYPSYQVAA